MSKNTTRWETQALIDQYARILTKQDALLKEGHVLREKIAKRLIREGNFTNAARVQVSSCTVREHDRKGYSYLRIRI